MKNEAIVNVTSTKANEAVPTHKLSTKVTWRSKHNPAYFALIESHLQNCVQVWPPHPKEPMNTLQWIRKINRRRVEGMRAENHFCLVREKLRSMAAHLAKG